MSEVPLYQWLAARSDHDETHAGGEFIDYKTSMIIDEEPLPGFLFY